MLIVPKALSGRRGLDRRCVRAQAILIAGGGTCEKEDG